MSEARPEDTVPNPEKVLVDALAKHRRNEELLDGREFAGWEHDLNRRALDALVAERDTLRGLLEHAADALHDAAWVIREDPHQPPLPPARTYVLPQTEDVEAGIRAALAAAGESDKEPGQ